MNSKAALSTLSWAAEHQMPLQPFPAHLICRIHIEDKIWRRIILRVFINSSTTLALCRSIQLDFNIF